MKKVLLLLSFLFTIPAYACSGYVIGFKGQDDIFDHGAFINYARHAGFCSKSFSWHKSNDAINYINKLNVPYEIYAFSKGAEVVHNVLKKVTRKPEYILTIGAYKTTNVNFYSYGVPFMNYFDHSGKGQKGPGLFLNVPHDSMQREVNKLYGVISVVACTSLCESDSTGSIPV